MRFTNDGRDYVPHAILTVDIKEAPPPVRCCPVWLVNLRSPSAGTGDPPPHIATHSLDRPPAGHRAVTHPMKKASRMRRASRRPATTGGGRRSMNKFKGASKAATGWIVQEAAVRIAVLWFFTREVEAAEWCYGGAKCVGYEGFADDRANACSLFRPTIPISCTSSATRTRCSRANQCPSMIAVCVCIYINAVGVQRMLIALPPHRLCVSGPGCLRRPRGGRRRNSRS